MRAGLGDQSVTGRFCFVPPKGDGTAHGHGFVALANVYQYSTLDNIRELIESNVRNLSPKGVVNRITSYMEHLHQEHHFKNAEHQENIGSLEEQFHKNNFGGPGSVHLSVRLATLEGVAKGSD